VWREDRRERREVVMSRLEKFIPRFRRVRYGYARCHVREILYFPPHLTLLHHSLDLHTANHDQVEPNHEPL
jgi:hypothetical protein